jgi:phage replication-related protein YjqB (UPF0714/DUF867 family)
MDKYTNYSQLIKNEQENIDFKVFTAHRENSSIAVIAPHGGNIEPGTSEVAIEIAKDDLSLALFEGKKPSGNRQLHLTSTNFDEPRCISLIQSAEYVVAIHGEKTEKPVVYIGGRDNDLCTHLQSSLEKKGFDVRQHQNQYLQGMAPSNICNLGQRGKGVQIELSAGLRKIFFKSLTLEGRQRPHDQLFVFTSAVRESLCAVCRL